MGYFTRIMIGLDLSDMDEVIIKFASDFVKVNESVETIYFVHVVNNLELTEHIRQKYGDLLLPNDETIKYQMEQEVQKYPEEFQGLDIKYEVLEGNPLKQLLHWSRVKLIELIIAGKKIKENGTGIVMEKLARKSRCSILFVTNNQSPDLPFHRILIPFDFSARSQHVFEISRELVSHIPQAKLIGLNVVKVPAGYYKIGKTFDEFAEIMIANEKKNWQAFQEGNQLDDLNMEMNFEVNKGENIAKIIFDFAQKNDIGMIIMSSKGQTDASVLLLGSVAEKLISYDYNIPLLLIKKPNDINDFFDALKEI